MVWESFYKIGDYTTRLPIQLTPNKSYNPKTWNYPVTWSGIVGWINVDLVQTTRTEIDLSILPPEIENAKKHILECIERAIKRLD